MTSSRVVWPGFELEVEEQGQWVEVGMVLDPDWRHVDAAGHGHFYDSTAKGYPTLRWVSQPCTMGHGDDCEAEGYYECSTCAEQVAPGTRWGGQTYIPGLVTYRLTVHGDGIKSTYVFGRQQWEAVDAAVRDAVQDVLAAHLAEQSTER